MCLQPVSHSTALPCPPAYTGPPPACIEPQPHSTAWRAPTTSLTCVPAAPFLVGSLPAVQPQLHLGHFTNMPCMVPSLRLYTGCSLCRGCISQAHLMAHVIQASGQTSPAQRPSLAILPSAIPTPDRFLLECQLREDRHFVLLTLAPGTVPGTPEVLNKCLWPSWVKWRLGEGGGPLSSGLSNCLANRPLVCKIERLLTSRLLGSWEV